MKVKTTTLTVIALTTLANATLPAPIPYPKGVWSGFDVLDFGGKVPQALVDNKGLVGLTASEDWDVLQTGPDTFNWKTLDNKIAAIKAAGFKYIRLSVTASSANTPKWLLDSLTPEEIIYLRDPGETHKTYCDPIKTALYWAPDFHAARLNLIRKTGERYANDPAIVAVNAQFANHNSNDWNIQDTIGTIGPCRDGNSYVVNQPEQWINAGWTIQKMLDVGKEILDTTAEVFPNQAIKLPVGGLADELVKPFLGSQSGYGSLAKMIVDYVATKPYANRFYVQRNTVDANWGVASTLNPPNEPGIQSIRYPKLLVWNHTRPDGPTPGQGGLQMVQSATDGATTNCRQGAGPSGPCGSACPPLCVLQKSLEISVSFNPSFIEIWPHDGMNKDLYSLIESTTLAMDGQLRGTPAAPINLRRVP
jgi:hypothetical protein